MKTGPIKDFIFYVVHRIFPFIFANTLFKFSSRSFTLNGLHKESFSDPVYSCLTILWQRSRVSSEKANSFRENFPFFVKFFFSRPFCFIFVFRSFPKNAKISREKNINNYNNYKKNEIFAKNTEFLKTNAKCKPF